MTAAPLLRVGACLEQDGTVLRDAASGTEPDAFAADDKTPLDDLPLRTWLGGLDAKGSRQPGRWIMRGCGTVAKKCVG